MLHTTYLLDRSDGCKSLVLVCGGLATYFGLSCWDRRLDSRSVQWCLTEFVLLSSACWSLDL